MQLRWTEKAANDLQRIADYLVQNTPGRAQGLIERIYDAAARCATMAVSASLRLMIVRNPDRASRVPVAAPHAPVLSRP